MSEPLTKLSLAARKNIKEFEPKINSAVAEIKKNLGLKELTIDVDYLEYENKINANLSGYENRPGWGVSNYIEALAENTTGLADDDLTKEAIEEALGNTAVIKFVYLDEGNDTATIELDKGVIKIVNTPKGVGFNQRDLGIGFEKLL